MLPSNTNVLRRPVALTSRGAPGTASVVGTARLANTLGIEPSLWLGGLLLLVLHLRGDDLGERLELRGRKDELQRFELLGLHRADQRSQADQGRGRLLREERPAGELVDGRGRQLEDGAQDLTGGLGLLGSGLVLEVAAVMV